MACRLGLQDMLLSRIKNGEYDITGKVEFILVSFSLLNGFMLLLSHFLSLSFHRTGLECQKKLKIFSKVSFKLTWSNGSQLGRSWIIRG